METGRGEKVANLRQGLILRGPLRHEIKFDGGDICRILIKGDIEFSGKRSRDEMLFMIQVHQTKARDIDCDEFNITEGGELLVYGQSHYFFNERSLEPIKKFREILHRYLEKMLQKSDLKRLLRKGLEKYLKDIEKYSEVRNLWQEVERGLKTFKFSLADPSNNNHDTLLRLRKVLEALEVTPDCDVPFEEKN